MIAHIDADAFFASVLQRKHPRLKGKQLLALGMGGGCVIAASYEAKALGVKTGMSLREARSLAPDAIALPADFAETGVAADQLFALLERWCPGGVERASVDEGYLCLDTRRHVIPSAPSEVRGVSRDRDGATRHDTLHWETFAKALQSEAHRFLDLPISIGIAETKTLAKMGSKAKKPRGICIILPVSYQVAPSDERSGESRCVSRDIPSFLREKPVQAIPGIGRALTPKLQAQGILSAWDFAEASQSLMKELIGKHGLELQAEVKGLRVYDIVLEPDPPKSISRCRSLRATSDQNFLYAQIVTHLARCSSKLRRKGMECAALGIWFRTADFGFRGAERRFGRYLCEEALLLPFAREAFEEVMNGRYVCHAERSAEGAESKHVVPLKFTQVGLVLHTLRLRGPRQGTLFEEHTERIEALQKTIDELRGVFGNDSIRYAPAHADILSNGP